MANADDTRWPARAPDGRPAVVGHRGAAALAPENTLEALAAGVASGAAAVEFDVVALAGGELVVTHDEGVAVLSPAELRQRHPRVPTLDEALVLIAAGPALAGVHVDIKLPGYEGAVVAALRRRGLLERALVTSCHPGSLRRFAELAPQLPRGLGYPFDRHGAAGRPWLAPAVEAALGALRLSLPLRIEGMLRAASATVASLERRLVSRAVVQRCHGLGVPVHVWTVNDPDEARLLAALGVDAIVSDDPRAVTAALLATLTP